MLHYTARTGFALSGDADHIPAVHGSLDDPTHMQHDDKAAETATSPSPVQLRTPVKHRSFSTGVPSRCCGELHVEAPAPSPASVRPKQAASLDAYQHAADAASTGSQCSQCLDAQQQDERTVTAGPLQRRSRQTTKTSGKAAGKAAGKGAGSNRRLRSKRQGKKAPLVMSECYAAAVRPVLQQPEEETEIAEASDR